MQSTQKRGCKCRTAGTETGLSEVLPIEGSTAIGIGQCPTSRTVVIGDRRGELPETSDPTCGALIAPSPDVRQTGEP